MSEYQLYLIALAASVSVFALNKAYQLTGKRVSAAVLTVGVYVVSFVLAVAWTGFTAPSLPVCAAVDPGACVSAWIGVLTDLLQTIGGYVAFAALIYQALLKTVLEKYTPAAWNKIVSLTRRG